MKKIEKKEINDFLTSEVTRLSEELQNKLNYLKENELVVKNLLAMKLIEVQEPKKLQDHYNSVIRLNVDKEYFISIEINLLQIVDNQVQVDNSKVNEMATIIFERVQNEYKYSIVESTKSLCVQTYSALYDSERYYAFKVKETISFLNKYFDLGIDLKNLTIPTEIGTHELENYKIKLQKNGKIYIMF